MHSAKLIPIWKWKMDFHLHQRIIDAMIYYIKLNNLSKQVDDIPESNHLDALNLAQLRGMSQTNSVSVAVKDEYTTDDVKVTQLHNQNDSFVRQSTKY